MTFPDYALFAAAIEHRRFWTALTIAILAVALALLLGVPFFIAMAVGATLFHGASDLLYRRIAYAIIAVSALISLPVFDRVFR